MKPARILILRGGAIGDFIVTLPVIAALRNRWPDGHLELIGYPHAGRLALEAGIINRFRSLDEAGIAKLFAWNTVFSEKDQQYFASFDIVVNFLHDPDGMMNDNLKRLGARVLLTASPHVEQRHATDHFLRALESLAIYQPDNKPTLNITTMVSSPPINEGASWIAVHPGSGSKLKNWPITRFLELAGDILTNTNCVPVFITGDAEREYIPDIDRLLKPHIRIHNMELAQLASILRTAKAYIGNDGGITHLAAAVGCPTIALFGPTNPDLWAPRGSRVSIIASSDKTMASIPVTTVIAQLRPMLPIRIDASNV